MRRHHPASPQYHAAGRCKNANRPSTSSPSPSTFGLLKFITVYLVISLLQSPSSSSSSTFVVTANPTTTNKNNNDEPPSIPRRLIFHNPPFENADDPLSSNVMNTIQQYKQNWDASNARKKAKLPNYTPEETVISFLSEENNCLELIQRAEPRLVLHYQKETDHGYKGDICIAAELYLNGGYYFATDIGVVEPIAFTGLYLPSDDPDPIEHLAAARQRRLHIPVLADIVTFSTVYRRQGGFFDSFVASMPEHPVLRRSLKYMVAYYEGTLEELLPSHLIQIIKSENDGRIPSRTNNPTIMEEDVSMGSFALSTSYRATSEEEWEEYAKNAMIQYNYIPPTDEATNTINNVNNNKKHKPRSIKLVNGKIVSHPIPAATRYSRLLHEVSLEDGHIKKMGLFLHHPYQYEEYSSSKHFDEPEYRRKQHHCNHVVFEAHQVYFYSRVPGAKGCHLEKFRWMGEDDL